jgi:hypothetical protein
VCLVPPRAGERRHQPAEWRSFPSRRLPGRTSRT